MSPDRQLLTTLGALRRQWRQRIMLESLVWIVVATIIGVVASITVLRAFTSPDADASLLAVPTYSRALRAWAHAP